MKRLSSPLAFYLVWETQRTIKACNDVRDYRIRATHIKPRSIPATAPVLQKLKHKQDTTIEPKLLPQTEPLEPHSRTDSSSLRLSPKDSILNKLSVNYLSPLPLLTVQPAYTVGREPTQADISADRTSSRPRTSLGHARVSKTARGSLAGIADRPGVSRHTLWRALERTGHSV